MSETPHCLPADVPAVHLRAPDGAQASVALHGGHVLRWVPAGGEDQLYLSPRSGYAAGQAIRGGVPVIFPQFSDRGPLPRHGFARTRAWERVVPTGAEDPACVTLQLTASPATRQIWPQDFVLELQVQVGGDALTMTLSCRNTGATPLSFQAALHTYLRVADLADATLQGLDGQTFWDALSGTHQQQAGVIRFGAGDQDRIYPWPGSPLFLAPAGPSGGRALRIEQQGFADVVVWNPGAARCAALADMPPDGWRQMVCVEAAQIHAPIVLAPGARWQGVQRLVGQAAG